MQIRDKLNCLLSSLPAKQNDSVQKKWFKNLSDRNLTDDQVALLSKGSKFALAPKEILILDIVCGVEEGLRQVPRDKKPFVDCARAKITQILKRASPPDNLTQQEQKAISELKSCDDIIILEADKGNCIVVMNKSD